MKREATIDKELARAVEHGSVLKKSQINSQSLAYICGAIQALLWVLSPEVTPPSQVTGAQPDETAVV